MSQPTVFADLVAHKREEVRLKRSREPIEALQAASRTRRPPASLAAVLAAPGIALIAEIKRRSLTGKTYTPDFDPRGLARLYLANGAAAISVLADETFFGGGPAVIREVVATVAGAIPVVYKDVVIDPYQVAEAYALGADAVLIIARAIDEAALRACIDEVRALGMDCVIEVFTPEDARAALAAGATIIGINNRDVSTFSMDVERSASMRGALPAGVLSISESGLAAAADVRRAARLGFDAVLIGEAILAAPDVAAKVREFSGALEAAEGHDRLEIV